MFNRTNLIYSTCNVHIVPGLYVKCVRLLSPGMQVLGGQKTHVTSSQQ